jgi:uncharacterized protein (TIGR03790 family)
MRPPRPAPTLRRRPLLVLLAALVLLDCGCGGGGGALATDVAATPAATSTSADSGSGTLSTVGAGDGGSATAVPPSSTSTATTDTAGPAAVDATVPADATAGVAGPAAAAPLAPTLPRSSLGADDLAVLVAEGDALSEAIALAYQQARGIPDAHVIRLPVPRGSDAISDSDFAALKAQLDARLPASVQATLVTWTQPSRVQGASCSMGLTSALAFGYSAAMCGGCNRTQASAYYDSDSTHPYADLRIRPSMMLGASTLAAAQALIARGVAADRSDPAASGWLVRTADAARSVRWPDFSAVPAAWTGEPAPILRYLDASAPGWAQELTGYNDLMFYFTGLARLLQLQTNHFLPGAVGDHLTSFGGFLPGGKGQMPATDWLAAGATASYGTVEEPCNYPEKFPRASVLIDQYLRGATVLEAYWKSVAWPGQGLFVGEPLARPWANEPSAAIEGDTLVIRSRALRRNGVYRVDWLDAGSSRWRTLDSLTAGQPRPLTWRVVLPAVAAGGRLRWVGPCALQPAQSCVLGGG